MRLFLAVPLENFENEIRSFLGRWNSFSDVRWITNEQPPHLTLYFFSAAQEAQLPAIRSATSQAAGKTPAFHLSLSGVGFFPDAKQPKILWIGAGGETKRLNDLQNVLMHALEREGFPREEKPFVPHATLGRFGAEKSPKLPPFEFPQTPQKEINHIRLYQSFSSSRGSRYEILEEFPLSSCPSSRVL